MKDKILDIIAFVLTFFMTLILLGGVLGTLGGIIYSLIVSEDARYFFGVVFGIAGVGVAIIIPAMWAFHRMETRILGGKK